MMSTNNGALAAAAALAALLAVSALAASAEARAMPEPAAAERRLLQVGNAWREKPAWQGPVPTPAAPNQNKERSTTVQGRLSAPAPAPTDDKHHPWESHEHDTIYHAVASQARDYDPALTGPLIGQRRRP